MSSVFLEKTIKILRSIVLYISILIFFIVFYIIAIVIEPEEISLAKSRSSEFFLPVEPIVGKAPEHIQDLKLLTELADAFPAPLLFLQEDEDIKFMGGDLFDLTYKNGYARITRLTYEIQDGHPIYLYCVYPKEAYTTLNNKGLKLLVESGRLNAFPAIKMEGNDQIRLHAQSNLALYALSIPSQIKDSLDDLGRKAVLLPQNIDYTQNEP